MNGLDAEKSGPSGRKMRTIVDVPMRIWHWAFAVCICTCLFTALLSNEDRMRLHMWSGIGVFGLLGFRVLWAVWGSGYARVRHYLTSPMGLFNFVRGKLAADQPHTPPGSALVAVLMGAAFAQATSGLFASDGFLYEGPLAQFVSMAATEAATEIHYRAYQVLMAGIGIHLLAQLVYAVLRSPLPLLMFTGRRRTSLDSVHNDWTCAVLTAMLAAVPVVALGYLLR